MTVDYDKMKVALGAMIEAFEPLTREEQRRLLSSLAVLLGGRLADFPEANTDGEP